MRWAALLAVLSIPGLAGPVPQWRLTQSEHFQVYAQSNDQRAGAILIWFEQLLAFFEQQGGSRTPSAPVRVIVFASEQEYQPFRLSTNATAYYVGAHSQDYIVIGTDDPAKFNLAAHEYAHLMLRNSGLQLPLWMREGLAEFFATLRITGHATELGGALPGRIRTLQRQTWIPMVDLLSLSDESQKRQERDAADLFYSQSWALTQMLLLSPDYAPGFQKFLGLLGSGMPGLEAFQTAYAKSTNAVTRDLQAFVGHNAPPAIQLPEVTLASVPMQVFDIAPAASRLLLAQLLLAAGEFDRAKALLSPLDDSAEVSAARGMIALHEGDSDGARRAWKRSIDQGITDATLCYHYAILADQAGLPAADIRPALERSIALQPDFDDAHYQLALLEKNAGNYDAAVREFHAMRTVSAERAYVYWLALADIWNQLGRRDEAQSAARNASEHASTAAERAHATQQNYIAQTDLAVQFARGASGQVQLVTTRKAHNQADWNPFIEPGDDIRRIQGKLREIDCSSVTTIRVEEAGKLVTLAIPDLQHVQMRHAPAEFVCGPQTAAPVIVDYARTPGGATDGIVRGMEF
jgi:tetratricopeptide (TPR) repeat protein